MEEVGRLDGRKVGFWGRLTGKEREGTGRTIMLWSEIYGDYVRGMGRWFYVGERRGGREGVRKHYLDPTSF